MLSRRMLIAITLALVCGAAGSAGSALGAQGTSCKFAFDVVASPGLSTSPSSGTVTSNGETGTADCSGPVNGKRPTGPGTAGVQGRYGTKGGDTCQGGGGGDGVQSFTIPTSGGAQHVTNRFTFTYGGVKNGLSSGQFQGDRMSGTFDLTPAQGDCANAPVTKFHLTGQGALVG